MKIGSKKLQVIKIKKAQSPLGSGSYGDYYRISLNRGVKVFGDKKDAMDIRDLKEHYSLYSAVMECGYLKIASKSGITPRNPKLVLVKFGGMSGYLIGIEMQHISGITVEDYEDDYNDDEYPEVLQCWEERGIRALEKVGVIHEDLHECNAMITRSGKLRVIDFSEDYITVSDRRQKQIERTYYQLVA